MEKIDESADLFTEKIYVKNPELLEKKLIAMEMGGAEKLIVVADFDRTLTKAFVGGKPMDSLVAVLRDENYLTKDYPQKAKALFAKYHPFENDQTLGLAQRSEKMEAWWREHFELLIASKLNLQDVVSVVDRNQVMPREGLEIFLKKLNEKNIPIFIVSAGGLGEESISLFLKKQGLFLDNIKIVSNSFLWDENGRAVGVRKPIIHSCNKNGSMIKNFQGNFSIEKRSNVLLLGDNLDDLTMADGLEKAQLLAVLFFNKKEDGLEAYQNSADVVIGDDGSMNKINEMLNQILKS